MKSLISVLGIAQRGKSKVYRLNFSISFQSAVEILNTIDLKFQLIIWMDLNPI